ncbi:hypothetical protein F511_38680 [Dorcoceras hygrometricum]|uniref:Uncharacterized protein n=1 Tax=Dorcoceras hygrometricum TaxID=472368 RepID=A0A2Z7DJ80_9LAMI|nr:hypothetical protein F511_38680 [Dorcoceras hygrometricum]
MAARCRAKRGTSLPPPCAKHGAQQHWLRPSSCTTVREAAAKSRPPCAASANGIARDHARGGAPPCAEAPRPAAVDRQSGPRSEARILRQPALEGLKNSTRTESPRRGDRNKSDHEAAARAAAGGRRRRVALGGRVRVSMTFRVVRTNQYNQDLRLFHSTNGNHLESPNEGSSIDHQVTIHLHAQNITMFPTNETCETATAEPAVVGSVEEESIFGGIVVEQGPAAESIEERENEPVVESTAEVLRTTSADDVDFIIQQVVTETAQLETDEGELFDEPDVSRATAEDQAVEKVDELERWFDLPYEVLIAGDTEQMVTTASDTDEEMEPFTPIRSTTRSETPSSGCTRSADEISMNGFSSSNWTETIFRRRSAAHGGGVREREGGAASFRVFER